jgi:diguanylate cyclase (GGDEF)-like protein/putative nucleotidyltransferase with HDIG domain
VAASEILDPHLEAPIPPDVALTEAGLTADDAAPAWFERPNPRRELVYRGLVEVTTVAALVAAAVSIGVDASAWPALLVFASGAMLAQVVDVPDAGRRTLHASYVFVVAAALILPPHLAAAVAVVSHVPRWLRRRRDLRGLALDSCVSALGGLAAWSAAAASDRAAGVIGEDAAWALAGCAACVALVLVDHSLRAWRLSAAGRPWDDEAAFAWPSVSVELAVASLGVGLAYFWETNAWLAPLAVAPLVLVYRSLHVPWLEEQARIDTKTGLYNARHFSEALASEIARAHRYNRPLSVLVADLDLLREVNNTHGHLAGDAVLAGVATVFRSRLRSIDVAARFGGEEFAILLPETGRAGAVALAHEIRQAVAETPFAVKTVAEPLRVTVSIGVATFPQDARRADDLLHSADLAVYRAKIQGRNRVVSAAGDRLEETVRPRVVEAARGDAVVALPPQPLRPTPRQAVPLIVPAAVAAGLAAGVIGHAWPQAAAVGGVALLPLLLVRPSRRQPAEAEAAQERAEELWRAAESLHAHARDVERANRLLRERSAAAMETLSAAVDARDSHTAGHSRRVQRLALEIGRELGLSRAELDVVGHAALFHDIGKLAVPEAILLKPAGLSDDEWVFLHRHPDEGVRIVERLGFLADALPAIRHHHERYDGTGYPDGLKGDEIPLTARIIHVADALDAMLTPRVYRPALEPHEAVEELRAGSGTQFCPLCIAALDRVLVAELLGESRISLLAP